MLVSFVKANRNMCRKLENFAPRFFSIRRDYEADLIDIINKVLKEKKPSKVLEVGGADRPLLSKNKDIFLCGLDIDSRPECFASYDKYLLQSITDPIDEKYDLLISKTLLEHVEDNSKSLEIMNDALREGGEMVHYLPSKNHPYSLCLRLVGPSLQKILIKYLRPDAIEVTGYPAYFDFCSPEKFRKLCEEKKFRHVEIKCYFQASDYFAFFVPVYILIATLENLAEFFNISFFASGFIVRARK